MIARIIVNRHTVAANTKTGLNEPCISVRTSRDVEYAREIELHGTWILKQDFENSPCSGARIWLEGKREDLVILG